MNASNHLKNSTGEPLSGGISTLLIGIGNSSRSDDGLGWAFVEAVESDGNFSGDTCLRYQLQVEDAELISRYDRVIFVDAFQGKSAAGFSFTSCQATKSFSFTTHRLPPETILFLCRELYGKTPEAQLLLLAGETWDLQTGLSRQAQENLQRALTFFYEKINNWWLV